MQYQVTSTNMDVTESMKVLAANKFAKLEKKFANVPDDLAIARIVMNKGSAEGTFEVSIDFDTGKNAYIGKGTDFSLETALIDAVDDIEKQVVRSKSKAESKSWEKRREMKRFTDNEFAQDMAQERDAGEWEEFPEESTDQE